MGTSKNYVDHFPPYLDHLPTSGWHFYWIGLLSKVDILRTTYLPPFVNVVFGCPLFYFAHHGCNSQGYWFTSWHLWIVLSIAEGFAPVWPKCHIETHQANGKLLLMPLICHNLPCRLANHLGISEAVQCRIQIPFMIFFLLLPFLSSRFISFSNYFQKHKKVTIVKIFYLV